MKCEKCGSEMKLQTLIYTSDPVRYGYKCPKCGNVQYSMIKEENNQMDYEKKYKETIAWIDIIMPTLTKEQQEDALENFPELTENEDERIRKDIMVLVKDWWDRVNKDSISTKEQMIAWLEKQGEQNLVEPKFKNGQWIVWQDKCYKVNYNGCGYELIDQNGLSTSLEYGTVDTSARLYDVIKDAKDGDILSYRDGQWIFIYKGIVTESTFKYYALLSEKGIAVNDAAFSLLSSCITPATKEQRDLLFQKMKEAGWKWNDSTKELMKINSYCQENCKGYQETGKCFADGGCDAKRKAEQEPAEWSEEDDYNLQCMIAKVTSDIQKGYVGRNNELMDWLKSIKGRIAWKPSEEQMRALCGIMTEFGVEYIDYNILESLYNDLKKLK